MIDLKQLDNKNISLMIPINELNEVKNISNFITIPYKEVTLKNSSLKRVKINKDIPIYRLNNSSLKYTDTNKNLNNFSIIKKLIKRSIKESGYIGFLNNKLIFKFYNGLNINKVFEVA